MLEKKQDLSIFLIGWFPTNEELAGPADTVAAVYGVVPAAGRILTHLPDCVQIKSSSKQDFLKKKNLGDFLRDSTLAIQFFKTNTFNTMKHAVRKVQKQHTSICPHTNRAHSRCTNCNRKKTSVLVYGQSCMVKKIRRNKNQGSSRGLHIYWPENNIPTTSPPLPKMFPSSHHVGMYPSLTFFSFFYKPYILTFKLPHLPS